MVMTTWPQQIKVGHFPSTIMHYTQAELTVRSILGTAIATAGVLIHLLEGILFSILYLLALFGKLAVNACSTSEHFCKFFSTKNGEMLIYFFEKYHWLCLLLVLLEFATASSLIVTTTRSGSRYGILTGTLMMTSSLSLHMIQFGQIYFFLSNAIVLIFALPYFFPLDGALRMMRPISIKKAQSPVEYHS